jgi:hypothetical protein
MSLTREAIVEQLQQILGDEQVLTDAQLLRERSIDNFRKLQNIFGVYTMPRRRRWRWCAAPKRSRRCSRSPMRTV